MLEIRPNNKNWHTRGDDTKARLDAAACLAKGKIVDAKDTVALLEAVLHPGDNVNIEGDNQNRRISWRVNFARSIRPVFMIFI